MERQPSRADVDRGEVERRVTGGRKPWQRPRRSQGSPSARVFSCVLVATASWALLTTPLVHWPLVDSNLWDWIFTSHFLAWVAALVAAVGYLVETRRRPFRRARRSKQTHAAHPMVRSAGSPVRPVGEEAPSRAARSGTETMRILALMAVLGAVVYLGFVCLLVVAWAY